MTTDDRERAAQIPLNLRLDALARFDGFHPAGNELAVAALNAPTVPGVFLYGSSGSGKSHLLQAFAYANDAPYRALRELPTPALLDGLDATTPLALDDLDAVLGDGAWELAILSLYERVVASGGLLVVAAGSSARQLEFKLADLASRCAALTPFRLRALDDAGKLVALTLRSAARGLTPDPAALKYLVERTARDMHALCRLHDALDRQSWETGRRVTVPFIRAYLDGVSAGSLE